MSDQTAKYSYDVQLMRLKQAKDNAKEAWDVLTHCHSYEERMGSDELGEYEALLNASSAFVNHLSGMIASVQVMVDMNSKG